MRLILKKNLNADPLSIPQAGRKMSKRLSGIVGCKYKTSSWHLNGFRDGAVLIVTLGSSSPEWSINLHIC